MEIIELSLCDISNGAFADVAVRHAIEIDYENLKQSFKLSLFRAINDRALLRVRRFIVNEAWRRLYVGYTAVNYRKCNGI